MELDGATEEHRQRRDDRITAVQEARMVAKRGSTEELPVEEFLAKHGIQGASPGAAAVLRLSPAPLLCPREPDSDLTATGLLPLPRRPFADPS